MFQNKKKIFQILLGKNPVNPNSDYNLFKKKIKLPWN